jgi:hypothetical protein
MNRQLAGRALTLEQKREVIERLFAVWVDNPELRLTQLIGNIYPCGTACLNCHHVLDHKDPYNVEDFPFVNGLTKEYQMMHSARAKLHPEEPEPYGEDIGTEGYKPWRGR